METWVVYLLKCADGSYYCGVTNDLKKRVEKHRSGKGSKFVRGHLPVRVVAVSRGMTRSDAQKCEYLIKQLPKREKVRGVKGL